MKRLLALLFSIGFLCSVLVASTHVHVREVDPGTVASCVLCQLASSPATLPEPTVVKGPPPTPVAIQVVLPLRVQPLEPNQVSVLSIAPKQSPPANS